MGEDGIRWVRFELPDLHGTTIYPCDPACL
jgi:hypothetical protein